jgi:protein-disulfide isomerase
MTRRTTLVVLTAVVALAAFATAVFVYQRHDRQQAAERAMAQSDAMVRTHSPVIGPASAPVTIVEFFDPACEACRAFHPYVKEILAAYPRQARLVIRYVPFHGDASIEGVRILEAARAQGRFETVMEALLEAQPVWASHSAPAAERAWEFARAAGLDLEQARSHAASGAVDRMLEQEVADLKAVGVRFTPTFFVNGKPLPEPDPRVLHELVKREVERAPKAP